MMGRPGSIPLSGAITPSAAVVAGLAAAIVAGAGKPAVLMAAGALAAPLLAAVPPGLFVGLLLLAVIVQDPLVDAGAGALRYADEALVLAGLAALAVTAVARGRGPSPAGVAPAAPTAGVAPAAPTAGVAPAAPTAGVGRTSPTTDVGPTSSAAGLAPAAPSPDVGPMSPTPDVRATSPPSIGALIQTATPPGPPRSLSPSSRPPLSRSRRLSPLDLPLAALCVILLASAIAAGVPPLVAALGMLALLKGPLAFQLAARAPLDRRACLNVADGLAMLVAGVALVGVAQRLGGETVFALTGRAAYFETWQGLKAPGLFSHHNALGHAAVLGGGLALALASAAEASGRRRGARRLRLAAACCLAGLLASASRESWIAAGVAAVATALLARSGRALGAAVALTGVLAVLGGLSYLASPALRAELERRVAGVAAGWHDYGLGFTGWEFRGEYRIYAALKSAEIAADHPLLGVGPGRFGGAVAERFGSPVHDAYRVLPLDGVHAPLDIFWARLPAEIGLLGAAAYALVFASAMVICARISVVRRADPPVRALAAGGFAASVAAFVFAGFSPALEDPLVAIPVFAWAGAAWQLAQSDGS